MSAFSVTYPSIVDSVTCDVAVAASDDADPKTYAKCTALWDTGAVFSVISKRLVDILGLQPIDRSIGRTVQGTYDASVYLLDVMLPNDMVVRALRVGDGEMDDFDILIGMDIISLGDFNLTNLGKTKFTFRIPAQG